MSKIISIGTAVPAYGHRQSDILNFMQLIYSGTESRKLKFLYQQSGIGSRYSVLPDYSRSPSEWKFYPAAENLEPFPSLEQRQSVFNRYAPQLSVDAIRDCLNQYKDVEITHLITVSCTGLSAPGLDLQVMELLNLNKHLFRTSINFMGCYAAIHALKIADAICTSDAAAHVLIVCTELCTLHFQKENTLDNIISSMLFGDGAAAALITSHSKYEGLNIDHFYSEVISEGKRDMAWELSSTGFLMTLSSYVPQLLEQDFGNVVSRAVAASGEAVADISEWCIHPGGKRILESVGKSLHLEPEAMKECYDVLHKYGNMSSATILFVLKNMLSKRKKMNKLFAASFGPGLTVETFTAHCQ